MRRAPIATALKKHLGCAVAAALGVLIVPSGRAADEPSSAPSPGRTTEVVSQDSAAPELRPGVPPAGRVRVLGSEQFKAGSAFRSVALSSDGKQMASVQLDGRVCLWLTASGQRIASGQGPFMPGDVAFAPDGKWLVTGGFGKIEFRDVPSLAVTRSNRIEGRLDRLAVSPDGRFVASGGADIRLWDARTDRPPRVLGSHGPTTGSLAFFPDGKSLLSAGIDSTVRIWDVETAKQRLVINVGFNLSPLTASLSADGKTIATSAGNSVRCWDAATGQRLTNPHFNGGGSTGRSVTFSPTGDLLAVLRESNFVTLWDRASGRDVFNLHLLPGASDVRFSADGKTLCIQGLDVDLRDVASGKPLSTVQGHRGAVTAIAASPDGHWIASGDMYGRFWFWDAATGRGLPANLKPIFNGNLAVKAMRFSHDGQRLWVRLGNVLEGLALAPDHESRRIAVNPFAADLEIGLSNDEQLLAGCGIVGGVPDIAVVNAVSLQTERHLSTDKRLPLSIAFRPGGEELAAALSTVTGEGYVRSWDPNTGRMLREYSSDRKPVLRLSYSPDGRYLAGTIHGFVLLWNAGTGDPPRKLDLADPSEQAAGANPAMQPNPGAIAFSPDGQLLAVAVGDAFDVFEVWTGGRVARLGGHEGGTHAIAFLPDGLHIATGGADAAAAVWDLAGVLPPPDPETLRFPRLLMDDLWKRLDSESPAEAYAAVTALAARPADAIHLMTERLSDPEVRTPRRLNRAIALFDAVGTEAAAKAQEDLVVPPAAAAAPQPEQTRAEAAFKSAAGELRRRVARSDPPTPEPPSKPPDTDSADMAYMGIAMIHPLRPPATRPAQDAIVPATRPAMGYGKARVPSAGPVAPPAIPTDQVLTNVAAVRRLATEGDPSVLATLVKWLHDGAEVPEVGSGSIEFKTALELLDQYRVEAEVPALVSLYNNLTADVTIREAAAVAVAKVGTPQVRDFLTDALSGQVLGFRGRLLVAASLVRLDSDAGRDVLIDEYQEYLEAFDGGFSGNDAARGQLATLADAKLVARLRAMLDRQTTQLASVNVRAMIEQMEINALPMDRLREAAADTNWERANRRYAAIFALRNQGGPDLIPFLRELKPWPPRSRGDTVAERQALENLRSSSIATIRKRCWDQK